MIMPQIDDLLLLREIHREGSIGRAARALGISQPAASQRLERIENRLGLSLARRSPNGTALTNDGAELLAAAVPLLRAADDLARDLERLTTPRPLAIAASQTIGEHLVGLWLSHLDPVVDLGEMVLSINNSANVTDAVTSGRVDLGFIESGSIGETLDGRVIGHDRLAAIIPAGHPWIRTSALTVHDLADERLIVREPGSGTRRHLEDELQRLGERPLRPRMELGSNAAVVDAVRRGIGAAVLSSHVARRVDDVFVLALPPQVRRRPLHAVWRRGTKPSGATASLLEVAARIEP